MAFLENSWMNHFSNEMDAQQEYAAMNEKINNGGRNEGIRYSKGNYFLFSNWIIISVEQREREMENKIRVWCEIFLIDYVLQCILFQLLIWLKIKINCFFFQ